MLEEKRKLAKKRKLSSIVNIILGFVWIYGGATRKMAHNKWNVSLIIIGIALIALSLYMLKDFYPRSKAKRDLK